MPAVHGRVKVARNAGGSFALHRFLLTFRQVVDLAPGSSDDQSKQREVGSSAEPADAENPAAEVAQAAGAALAADGTFTLTLPDLATIREPVEAAVLAPNGAVLERATVKIEQLSSDTLSFSATPAQAFVVRATDTPGLGQAQRLTGRVIGPGGEAAPPGLPIVVWGVHGDAGAAPRALLSMQTQVGGYFSAPWPDETLVAAYAEVAGERAPISLVDAHLPSRAVLVVARPLTADDCLCEQTPPRAPDPHDLAANPEAFSQDLGGGCISLTMPNRVVEEYSYFTVVRTTEPEVRPMNSQPPIRLPHNVVRELTAMSVKSQAVTTRSDAPTHSVAEAPSLLTSLDVRRARDLLTDGNAITPRSVATAAITAEAAHLNQLIDLLGGRNTRAELDGAHSIDWDATPTLYEATTVALGHVLHFRQVWRADGYSLGDLLYSLPLAPGQKRQVSMLDWTRRTSGRRDETLESEEQMRALVERDRDISEIVGSHLDERIDGGSESSTSAGGGGIGAGLIGTGFGVFAGVAGGASGSSSSSWQDSSRTLAGNSLQQLRDRTVQRAAAVRSTRSTVVQTVAQGETVRAETEVVANHNHCHALTVEYFEVLRHFQVSQELVHVSECVFVPLPMLPFDQAKVRRWRATLLAWLRRPELARAFDAIERIASNWDGWDYPEHRFSEEAPEELEGELRMSFVIPRPRDDLDGLFQIDRWHWLGPFLPMAPFAMFNHMADEVNKLFRDVNRVITAEFATQLQRARDAYFAREIAPYVAEQLVHRMRFAYVTRAGTQTVLPMDATLISKYVDGVPLYVSIRESGMLPPLPREEIARFRIYLDDGIFGSAEVPPETRILVRSGRARYRSPHMTHVLFDAPRADNDLSDGDDVIIPTPTSREERKDPRAEDRRMADELVKHLNEHLEYYHQAIWASIDPQRRYLLLDGIIAPNSGGRSVASVVENRLIGIVGNSLVLPVTPGIHLDPSLAPDPETGEHVDLIHAYAAEPPPPLRISVPTRGVYAEAIMGDCNACELKDDTRFWHWEESPLPDDPTPIDALSTESRQAADPDMTPTPLPAPIVNIQNAPALPDPLGLSQAFEILGRSDIFREASGLAGTQRNALAAFNGVMDTAKAFGGMAAKLAQQQEMGRNVDRTLDQIRAAEGSGMLTHQQAQDLAHAALQSLAGDGGTAEQNPVHDPAVRDAIEQANEAPSGSVTVTSPGETVHASFEDPQPTSSIGATFVAEDLPPLNPWVSVGFTADNVSGVNPPRTYNKPSATRDVSSLRSRLVQGRRVAGSVHLSDLWPALTNATTGFLRADPSDLSKFQLKLRLRVVYPAAAGRPGVVGGTGRLPLVVIAKGNHKSWTVATEHATGPAVGSVNIGGVPTPVIPHDVDTITVNDGFAGYAYLQEDLARQGIISVSVDMNFCNFLNSFLETRSDLIVEAIRQMAAEASRPASRLFNRIDFDNVGLLGHSRGGDAVVRAMQSIGAMATKPCVVKTVCSLAPTDFTGSTAAANRMTIGPTDVGFYLVVYGGLDNDVSGTGGPTALTGTGFRHYDRARCPKAMVFLDKCCHNSFNTVWHSDGQDTSDARVLDKGAAAPADHKKLALEYICELFRWRLQNVSTLARRFDGRNPNSLATPASLQWMFGSQVKVVEDFENPTTNLLGGARAVTAPAPHIAAIRDETAVTFGGTPGTSLGVHMPHQGHMLQIEWAGPRATGQRVLRTDVPAGHKDWSGFDTLLVSLGGRYDSTSDATIAAEWLPRVRVILTDTANASATVDFNAYGAGIPGRPIRVLKDDVNAAGVPITPDVTLMRAETIPIGLSLFAGVDLHNVKSLSLELEPAGIVTAFVDNIHVVKR